MLSNKEQLTEQIIFDGSIGVGSAILLALFIATVAAWLMWRERRTLGTSWAALFWVLRMTALGTALWMLAGPMQEHRKQQSKPQSIAILADGSSSMVTVDPQLSSDTLRWALSAKSEGEGAIVTLCDRAVVALNTGKAACLAANQKLTEHRPLEQIRASRSDIAAAVVRAVDYCQKLAVGLDEFEDLGDRVARAEDILDGTVTESLTELKRLLDDNQVTSSGELATLFESVTEGVSAAGRRMESLSHDVLQTFAEEEADSLGEVSGLTRREKAAAALDGLEESVLSEFDSDVRIRRFMFDERVAPVDGSIPWSIALDSDPLESEPVAAVHLASSKTGSLPTTNLSAMLEQLASSQSSDSTRLALVLSDGHHNSMDSPPPQEIAAGLVNLPVYFVPVGSTKTLRDVQLHRVEAPSSVTKDDTATIETIVTATNCDGLSTEVVLRRDGVEVQRKLLAFVGSRIDRRVNFQIQCDELGIQEYEISVELVDEESNTANNVAPVTLEVVRDKIRVLLVDGISQYEYRFLQQLFRRDRHVECEELLFYPRVRGTGEIARRLRLPETADDWSVYDVVVIGDVGPRHFSSQSQQALADYVRQQNGHLILIAGRDHMPHGFVDQPLMELLPVERNEDASLSEPHGVAFTEEGKLHSAMAIESDAQSSRLAWENTYMRHPLYELSVYSKPKESARTLLRAVPVDQASDVGVRESLLGRPAFLSWHQVGGGRVVYLASPQTYLLRFRRGDSRHHRFWGQMLRWITAAESAAGSETIRISTNHNRYHPNEPVEVTVWLKDQTGRPLAQQEFSVEASTLEGVVGSYPMEADEEVAGRYFATISELTAGTYELALAGEVIETLSLAREGHEQIRKLVTIESSENLEMIDTSANVSLLEQIAKVTGGQIVPPTAMSEVLKLASLTPEVTETVRRTPLWNRWTNLWIVFGCLAIEWVVRKQKGLV